MKAGKAHNAAAYLLAHGSPFERHLAEAWYAGGEVNCRRLVNAFPDLFLRALPLIGDI